ncbi:MAG: glycosyl transferase [Clostridia bacterium]|nr:glycosyl transferase [Clostridia bacterium]
MIPKTIHYCWFGRNPKPELAERCIASWKKRCPDYEIIEWNEDNFDVYSCPLYVRQAYEAKKWAFVSDYARLKVVHDHGGIYLDTDVELVKGLDALLGYDAFFGFEDGKHVATGLGFGAVKGAQILREMLQDYEGIPFVLADGSYDTKTCPVRNTEALLHHGLQQKDQKQLLNGNICVLPSICMCPIDFNSGKRRWSPRTISIHWFSTSWMTEAEKKAHDLRVQARRRARLDTWIHLPNRMLKKLLGEAGYARLKKLLRRG